MGSASPSPSVNCEAPGYKDPSEESSSQAVCTTSAVGEKEASALALSESVTNGFSATTIGAENRKGKELFNKLIKTSSGGDMPSTDEFVNYVMALLVLIVPPAVFLLLNSCCCFWCSCMHGCCWLCPKCCRCCKCIPSDHHVYTKCEKTINLILWIIFSLMIFVFAIMGVITGTYKLVDSSTATVCTWDDTFLRFSAFMNNVQVPLDTLDTNFADAVSGMQSATQFPQSLVEGVEHLADALGSVKSRAESARVAADNNYPGVIGKTECMDAWQEIVDQSLKAETETNDQAINLNQVLKDIQDSIKENIVEQAGPVREKIQDSLEKMADMQDSLNSTMNPAAFNLFTGATVAREQRDNSAFAQWGWVFIVVAFAFIGTIGMTLCHKEVNYEPDGLHPKSNPNLSGDALKLNVIGGCFARFSTCSWVIMLSFGTLGALFALIYLPLTAVLSDACEVLPQLPANLGEITGNSAVNNITNTCWNENGNLFEGFGLDKVISTDDISFGNLTDSRRDPDINDEGLIALKDLLDDMRDDPNQRSCYVAANTTGDVVDTYSAIAFARQNVAWVKTNFSEDETAENIETQGKRIITSVNDAVCQFKTASKCYFIKETWSKVSELLCVDFNGSLSNMALYELLIAIMAIPYAIVLLCLNKKFGGHGPTKVDESIYSVDAKEVQAIELADGAYYN